MTFGKSPLFRVAEALSFATVTILLLASTTLLLAASLVAALALGVPWTWTALPALLAFGAFLLRARRRGLCAALCEATSRFWIKAVATAKAMGIWVAGGGTTRVELSVEFDGEAETLEIPSVVEFLAWANPFLDELRREELLGDVYVRELRYTVDWS